MVLTRRMCVFCGFHFSPMAILESFRDFVYCYNRLQNWVFIYPIRNNVDVAPIVFNNFWKLFQYKLNTTNSVLTTIFLRGRKFLTLQNKMSTGVNQQLIPKGFKTLGLAWIKGINTYSLEPGFTAAVYVMTLLDVFAICKLDLSMDACVLRIIVI